MSHLVSTLASGERVLARARVSPFAYLAALGILLLTLWPGSISRLASTELALTDQRLIGRIGTLRRQQFAWPLKLVERVRVERSLLGYLFGYGTVIAIHADSRRVKFRGIGQPLWFQAEVEDAVEIAVLGRSLRAMPHADTIHF